MSVHQGVKLVVTLCPHCCIAPLSCSLHTDFDGEMLQINLHVIVIEKNRPRLRYKERKLSIATEFIM